MRKPKLPNDMTPSPRPWAWAMATCGGAKDHRAAIVKGADGSLVCVCHPSNAKEMCGGAEPVYNIYAYGREYAEDALF